MNTQSPDGRTQRTVESFKKALADNLYYRRGQAVYTTSPNDNYTMLAYTVRDYLMERWRKTVDNCGFFSSDRSICEYCQDIWQVKSLRVEP